MTNDEQCKRENLLVILPTWSRWTVDDEGEAVSCVLEDDVNFNDKEFTCENCDEFFNTWDAALEHLKVKESA